MSPLATSASNTAENRDGSMTWTSLASSFDLHRAEADAGGRGHLVEVVDRLGQRRRRSRRTRTARLHDEVAAEGTARCAFSTDAFTDAAKTVINATTPTPIINAEAVPDGAPRVARRVLAGEPTGDAAHARQRQADQPADRPGDDGAEHDDADDGQQRAEPAGRQRVVRLRRRPRSARRRCRGRDRRADRRSAPTRRLRPSTATSRIAASGGTRDARRAGMTAATTVTPRRRRPPRSRPSSGFTTRPPAGRSSPKPASTPLSRPATPMPATKPSTEARSPITNASTSTDPITCRRLAPTARSSAISRVRWATMIENVL